MRHIESDSDLWQDFVAMNITLACIILLARRQVELRGTELHAASLGSLQAFAKPHSDQFPRKLRHGDGLP
jgi:hypothetical protein